MSDSSELNLESLPVWMQDALGTALKKEPARSVLAHRDTAAWPLLLDAAVVGTFLPRDLAPEAVNEDKRPEAEQIVLSFAEITHAPDGVRWSLTQQARTEVLAATHHTEELQKAISRTAKRFGDLFSRALRECLSGTPAALASSGLKWLEAIRIAVASLSGISGMTLPSLADLDREIEFRRLLGQFERMVGWRTEDTPPGKEQRFFGRDEELERLRDYVGVISADSLRHLGKRAVNFFSRKIKGRKPMLVWGLGGVGKTTLVSKFMLEHAEAAASRFPFAYLDFDRTTISARQRSGLLAEMCVQTGAQFDALSKPLADLRVRVSQLARKLEATGEHEYMSFLTQFTLEFRELVDKHLKSLESTFEWARPFLLVFDTFEVVQYSQDDVASLEEFVRGFSRTNEKDLWPRLRLIISGRKAATSFLETKRLEELKLGPLDPKGSAELLLALARDAGRPITEADAHVLVGAIAKAAKEESGGVQPLQLWLVGDLFQKATEDGSSFARSLAHELEQPLKADGPAAKVLIDGILIRRALRQVNDPRVKALADPGLVVRRITPGVISQVMTRGTADPSVCKPKDDDADPVKPWIIDDIEAQIIFDAFRKEVTLVESDGDMLRHRPDVRQQMLPLIRAQRPNRFNKLNRLAFDYFRTRVEQNENDLASAAEAVYHGLWLNEPLGQLNRLWRNSPAFDPKIDPEEFDKGSSANIFLRAKSRAALATNEVSQLPRDIALDWLDSRSIDLLAESRIEDAIYVIRKCAGDNYEALDKRMGTASVLVRLLYRAGIWNDGAQLALRHLDSASIEEIAGTDKGKKTARKEEPDSRRQARLSLLRTWATIVGKNGGPAQALERIEEVALFVQDPLVRVEIAAHAVIAAAQQSNVSQYRLEQLKSVVEEGIDAVNPSLWRQKPRILRLAILTSSGLWPELLEKWVESRERVTREIEASEISDLLSEIFREGPLHSEVMNIVEHLRRRRRIEALNELDRFWRLNKGLVLKALRERADLKARCWRLVAFDHSDWMRPLGNALARALKQEHGDALNRSLEMEAYRTGQWSQRRQEDGVSVVQAAADDGRFLSLARALVEWEKIFPNREEASERVSGYPQDVFDISRALLRWHSTILESFGPPSSPQLRT